MVVIILAIVLAGSILGMLLLPDQTRPNPFKDESKAIKVLPKKAEIKVMEKEVVRDRVLTPNALRKSQQATIRLMEELKQSQMDHYYDRRELNIDHKIVGANEAKVAARDAILDIRSASQDLRDDDFKLDVRDAELDDKERKIDLANDQARLDLEKKELEVKKEAIKVLAATLLVKLQKEMDTIIYYSNMLKVQKADLENQRYSNHLHNWEERLNNYEKHIRETYQLMSKELDLQEREGRVRLESKRLGLQNLFDRTMNSIERLRIQDSKPRGLMSLFQNRSSAVQDLLVSHEIWTSYR